MKTVCLRLAKELKEAGYPQDNYFVWFDMDGKWKVVEKLPAMPDLEWYSSPTADEILDQLPIDVTGDEGMRFDINIYRELNFGRWVIGYWWDEDSRRKSGMTIENMAENTLVDAAAKMWLYLKKMELI